MSETCQSSHGRSPANGGWSSPWRAVCARAGRSHRGRVAASGRTTGAAAGLAADWSLEQIAGRLRIHPDDKAMRVSHETIYRALYLQAWERVCDRAAASRVAGLAGGRLIHDRVPNPLHVRQPCHEVVHAAPAAPWEAGWLLGGWEIPPLVAL